MSTPSVYQAGPFPENGFLWVGPVPSGGTPPPVPSSLFSDSGLSVAVSNPIYMRAGTKVSFYVDAGQYTVQHIPSGYNEVVSIGTGTGGGTGTVTSVSGTTNQIGVATGTTTPVISLSSTITLPGTVNKLTLTAPATGSTLTIADGKTLTASNSITLAGTDSTTMTFPSVSATIPRTVASGATAMRTSLITSNTADTATTVSAPGVLTTDVISVGFNGIPTGITGFVPGAQLTVIAYPTADNVNLMYVNNTGSSITPSAVTLNWRVSR